MQGFDGLVKEIDSLTYNARSVLNALIRSVMRAGSSSGYTVTRKVNSTSYAITLSRGDIYILSQFYSKWEETAFSKNGFITARIYADTLTYYADAGDNSSNQLTNQATPALVKHSEILFLSSSNVSNYVTDITLVTDAQTEYWLGLVSGASNPLLITNSCPVPVNLRTPVFDSTLSTRHYNQYETYLFPFGYYAMDILGYSGDGTTHSAGGNRWNILGDTSVMLVSPKVMLGDFDNSSVKDRASDGLYSTVCGLNTFAYGDYSISGGSYCVVSSMGNSGVSLGSGNVVETPYGSAVGGSDNIVAENYGSIVGGYSNRVSGLYGLAGNYMTSVGGYPYRFVITQRTEPVNTCQYVATSESCTATTVSDSMGYNRMYVYADDPWFNAELTRNPETVFKSTYQVVLYGWNGADGGPAHIGTHLLDSMEATVSSVTPVSTGGCYITLTSSIPGDVYGGLVSVYRENISDTLGRGYASTVFGLGTVAGGVAQTVVGKYNSPSYGVDDYNFIVGCGTTKSHANSLMSGASGTLITHDYMNGDYPTTISYVSVGGSAQYGHTNAYASTYISSSSSYVSSMYLAGETVELSSVYVSGAQAYVNGRVSLCSDGSSLFSAMLSSSTGVTGLVSAPDTLEYVTDKGIGYYALSGAFIYIPANPQSVGILGSYVNVTSENKFTLTSHNSIWMTFGSLQLRGDTYGTLTADCYAMSFPVVSSVYSKYPDSPHSGFYFTTSSRSDTYTEYGADIVSAYTIGRYVYGFEMASSAAYVSGKSNPAAYIGTTLPVTAWVHNGTSTISVNTKYLVTTDYLSDMTSAISTLQTNLAHNVINDITFAPGQSDYIYKHQTYVVNGVPYVKGSDIGGMFSTTGVHGLASSYAVGYRDTYGIDGYFDVATQVGGTEVRMLYVATSMSSDSPGDSVYNSIGSAFHFAYAPAMSAVAYGCGYGYAWNLDLLMNLYILTRAVCPYTSSDSSSGFSYAVSGESNTLSFWFNSAGGYLDSPPTDLTPNITNTILAGGCAGGYITYATLQCSAEPSLWHLTITTTAPTFTALSLAGLSNDWMYYNIPIIAKYSGR